MILVCAGTRPELLKLAPVVRLAKSRGLPVHVHCTMQSPNLVDQAILPWDSWETYGTNPQWGMVDLPEKPWSLVVVQGDTRTAYRAAVWAYEQGIPVFHLEAGVRTYDLASPCPEEGYRRSISVLATYHACTTQHNGWNLVNEGLEKARGLNKNTLPTAMRITGSPIVESVRARGGTGIFPAGSPRPVVVTLHRRENRGHFDDILHGVLDASKSFGMNVFPTWIGHPNGWAAQENTTHYKPLPPIGADAMADSIRHAVCVVTDSGGLQEECNAVGTFCVVARDKTDRPESLGKGGAILAGTSREGVRNAIWDALVMDAGTIDRNIFGDGTASEKVVSWWTEIVG